MLRSGAEQAAAALGTNLSRVVLGVDHRDASRTDRKVVDVGSVARDAAVVQKLDAMAVKKLREARGHTFLTLSAARPRALMLWLAQPRQPGADTTEADSVPGGSCALFARRASALVFSASAGAGSAALKLLDLRQRCRGSASFARDYSRGAVVERTVALPQLPTTTATPAGIPE
jgi:hypothetical protein